MNGNEKTGKDGKEVLASKIDSILNAIRERDIFAQITRYQYLDYDMEEEMQIIEAIGKSRSPYFVIDDENRFAYENFIRWCRCDSKMQCQHPGTSHVIPGDLRRGIYLAGATGTGKSWCLDIMQAYCWVMGFKVKYFGDRQISPLAWCSVRADALCDIYTGTGDILNFKKRNILSVQDFGSEPQESLYMGNRLEVMRSLFEYRGDRQDCLTLITSNLKLGGEKLQSRYGDRVASRLAEMCNYFEMKGADRRKWRNPAPDATK